MRSGGLSGDPMKHRGLVLAVSLFLLTICQGCTQLATYGEDRVRDLSDVVDVRYGVGFGLGASVQCGETFSTGLGCSTEWYQREWFGRKSVEVRDGLFANGLIVGFDGDYLQHVGGAVPRREGNTTGSRSLLIFKNSGHNPAWTGNEEWFTQPGGFMPDLDTFRIGGAVFLPGVNGGLYLNAGEAIDFLCGLVTFDLMNDDGYPKFSMPAPREPAAPTQPEPAERAPPTAALAPAPPTTPFP
jgi:hypothetical protein